MYKCLTVINMVQCTALIIHPSSISVFSCTLWASLFLKQISILISGNSFHIHVLLLNESISLFIACIGEKFPFKLHEHKYFDNKLIIKYTKWSIEKTLKLINKKVSVRITLNLSLTIHLSAVYFSHSVAVV